MTVLVTWNFAITNICAGLNLVLVLIVVRIRPRVPIASTQTVDLSQTSHAEVTSVPVPTRLSRHSHQLQLQLDKKKPNKLRTALECISSRAITIVRFLFGPSIGQHDEQFDTTLSSWHDQSHYYLWTRGRHPWHLLCSASRTYIAVVVRNAWQSTRTMYWSLWKPL